MGPRRTIFVAGDATNLLFEHLAAQAGQHVVATMIVQDDAVKVAAVDRGHPAERVDRLNARHRPARRRPESSLPRWAAVSTGSAADFLGAG